MKASGDMKNLLRAQYPGRYLVYKDRVLQTCATYGEAAGLVRRWGASVEVITPERPKLSLWKLAGSCFSGYSFKGEIPASSLPDLIMVNWPFAASRVYKKATIEDGFADYRHGLTGEEIVIPILV